MNDFDQLNNLFPRPREEIINMQSYSAPLENRRNLLRLDSVSYTHLTLPTN